MGAAYVINYRKDILILQNIICSITEKTNFAMSITSFILWNTFPKNNIEPVVDRFLETIPGGRRWEYQQVSWLSSHSSKTIRMEPFSAVLVRCACFLRS